MNLISIAFLLGLSLQAHAYKILGLFPYPGKSHFDVFQQLLIALAEKGHDVTVLSHYPLQQKMERYRDISLSNATQTNLLQLEMDMFQGHRTDMYFIVFLLAHFAQDTCKKGLAAQPVQELIRSEEKFDLIITEYFNTDCFLGLVHKLNVPFISMSSCTMMAWLNRRFANPENPAYIPNNFMDYSDELSFFERVENTLMYLFTNAVFHFLMDVPANAEAKKYFGDDLPPLSEIAANTSLMLVNSHFSLNLPRPLVPGVIEVGGLNVKTPGKVPKVRLLKHIILVACTISDFFC